MTNPLDKEEELTTIVEGFGSPMIELALSSELQGLVQIDHRQRGVICTIDSPLKAVLEDHGAAAD